MANGDAAAAAGLATFAPTQDIRMGYDNDNIRGDELAAHLTAGTHPAAAITSGTFNADRIPSLDASKTGSGIFDVARIPDIDYRKVTVDGGDNIITWANGSYAPKTGSTVYAPLAGGFTFAGGVGIAGDLSMGASMYNGQVYNQTNTGRAVYVASNGLFGIGSSSERFKKNIKDANLDTAAILQIAVKHFNYKKSFDQDDTTTHLGVIAEDLVNLGLDDFVFFDENGNADGVAYEKLALAALAVIQQQQTQLDAIEARLTALETN